MIEIKVTEKNDDSFDIYFKVKAVKRSQYIDQVISILDALYQTDKDLFIRAVMDSEFGQTVTSK